MDQGRWKVGAEAPPHYFFSPSIEIWSPFSTPLSKFCNYCTLYCTQQWLMASLIIRFFSSLIPPSQRAHHSRQQRSRVKGAKRLSGGEQNLKLSAVFKIVSLLIGEGGAQACRLVWQTSHGPYLVPTLVQTFATL